MRDCRTLSSLRDRSFGGWLEHQAPRSRLLPTRGDIIVARCVLAGVAALVAIIFFMSSWR